MLTKTLTVVLMAATFVAASTEAAAGQDAGTGFTPTAQAASGQTQSPQPQPGPAPTRQPQQFVNIKLEMTISITDQRGAALAPTKTVLMHAVDRDNARVRTGRPARSGDQPGATEPAPILNVDARPEILSNGRLRVSLMLEYRPDASATDKMEAIHINESLSAILEDGKPMVLSQTADPAGDRNVKVELKATILR